MKILLSKTRALMKVTAEILTENVIKKTFLRKSFVDIICSGLDIDYFARMKKKRDSPIHLRLLWASTTHFHRSF